MCGRLIQNLTFEEVGRDEPSIEDIVANFQRLQLRFNLAPGQLLDVLVENRTGELEFRPMRWGLLRPWSQPSQRPLINARAETLHQLPTFRDLLPRKRCLVPMAGYYEWRKVRGQRIPYYIQPTDRPLGMFAGLYDAWVQPDGEIATSFCIVTTVPSPSIAYIHNRMPVMLRPGEEELWLRRDAPSLDRLRSLLRSYPDEYLESWAVSDAVNDIGSDGPELIRPRERQLELVAS